MAFTKRNLASIKGLFTKPIAELNSFIDEQEKRKAIAHNNIIQLNTMLDQQADIVNDSISQTAEALAFKNKLTALIE